MMYTIHTAPRTVSQRISYYLRDMYCAMCITIIPPPHPLAFFPVFYVIFLLFSFPFLIFFLLKSSFFYD